jgi:hypothetical protein
VLKAAAIDVGSSATRLSLLAVRPSGAVVHSELRRFEMRLGTDVFAHGRVLPPQQAALVVLFEQIAKMLQDAGVRRYRAVATSAMRDAANGPEVAAAIRAASGLHLDIISGQQEGALAHRALVRALGSVDPTALLVDLGGGSLEIERHGQGPGLSLPMGTVRLLTLFPELGDTLSPEGLVRLTAALSHRLRQAIGTPTPAVDAIGTGGNLEALAKVLGQAQGPVAAFDAAALPHLAATLAPIPVPDRARHYPIRADRADLFLPAVLTLQVLAEAFGVRRFVVPRTGLREALLLDLLPHGLMSGHCGDPGVSHLALALFELLFPLHGLWPPARRGLCAVAHMQTQQASRPLNRRLTAEERAACTLSAALLRGEALSVRPSMSAGPAHAARVWAGLVQLATAAAAGLDLTQVQHLTARMRLDLVTHPAVLYLGRPVLPQATQIMHSTWARALTVC